MLRRQLALAQEAIAGVHTLRVSLSPVGVDRELVEQPVLIYPILYEQRFTRIRNCQTLLCKLITPLVDALFAAEASSSMQGLGACRAGSGCLHKGEDNLIVGVFEFFLQPGRIEETYEDLLVPIAEAGPFQIGLQCGLLVAAVAQGVCQIKRVSRYKSGVAFRCYGICQ